ncbi:hypothetical protein PVAND_008668 [Polypedilum vanderplanki]|uniref:non-specific serine/threonine protein kinase n=1 Tax=Polypedilum vanderplanki TaxID=319348 RepID=A0A9J6CAP2_POLVA|nr:hypothetical protein PVAND_008668 [Polypedilum vanderplanki]
MDKSKKQLQENKKVMKSKLVVANNHHNYQNGRTSSDDEHNSSWRETNRNHHRAKTESYEEEEAEEDIIEIDSEDSRDATRNNKENRHRAYENVNEQNNHDSERDSTSSDIVVVRDDFQAFYNDIEELSRINTLVQIHPDDKVSIKNFKILKLLGTGAYGKVFSVEKLDGIDKGEIYAMKVLEKHKVTQKKKTTEHTRTEREVLEKVIDCPFLATLYYAFQTSEKLYLIMEFVQGGELFSHLYKSENFEENQVRFYIAEIVVALEQLHQQNIIYRDIKLENILLDKDGHIIITDFGLSKELKDGARTSSYCGTIEYMAPEIVNPRNGHDLNVDWWSVGVLIIELLSGQSPFSRENEESNQQIISERIQHSAPNIPDTVGDEARDLILKLLEKDPKKRLGYVNDAADIKNHRFFRNIDWNILKEKSYTAPMIPKVCDKYDVSQFSEDFTNQPPVDGPADNGPPQGANASKYFRGYSFVAPKFRRKTVTPDLLSLQIADKPEMMRPTIEDVFKAQSKRKSPFFIKYRISQETALIGDGTYSLCMECLSLKEKKKFAVKILKIDHDTSQEIDALKKCQGHPNIVELVETIKDENFTYIVFELLRGDELFSRIREHVYFTEDIARTYFRQIVDAVSFMHKKFIVHADLKPENIKFMKNSLDYEEKLKILDFGFAHTITDEEKPPCFTLDYAAPESLIKGPFSENRDIWSLGVILYTMLIGNTPFKPQNTTREHDDRNFRIQITENIRKGKFNCDNNRWCEISADAQDLICKLLKVNQDERLSIEEILVHRWLHIPENNNDTTMIIDNGEIERADSDATIINDTDSNENEDDKTKMPSDTEIRKSNDDSSSGIVISNEGSSVSEIEEHSVQISKSEEREISEIIIETKDEEPILSSTNNAAEILNKSPSEQLEPENLSLKPADINNKSDQNNDDVEMPDAETLEKLFDIKNYKDFDTGLTFKDYKEAKRLNDIARLCEKNKEVEPFEEEENNEEICKEEDKNEEICKEEDKNEEICKEEDKNEEPYKVIDKKDEPCIKEDKLEEPCIENDKKEKLYNEEENIKELYQEDDELPLQGFNPLIEVANDVRMPFCGFGKETMMSKEKSIVTSYGDLFDFIQKKKIKPEAIQIVEKVKPKISVKKEKKIKKEPTPPTRRSVRQLQSINYRIYPKEEKVEIIEVKYEKPVLRTRKNNQDVANKTVENLPEKKENQKQNRKNIKNEKFIVIKTASSNTQRGQKRKNQTKDEKFVPEKKPKVEIKMHKSAEMLSPKRNRNKRKVEEISAFSTPSFSRPSPISRHSFFQTPQSTGNMNFSPFYRAKAEPTQLSAIRHLNFPIHTSPIQQFAQSFNYIDNRNRNSMIICRKDSFAGIKTEMNFNKPSINVTLLTPSRL